LPLSFNGIGADLNESVEPQIHAITMSRIQEFI